MVNQELIKYIQQQIQNGVDKEEIKRVLIAQGWQEADINEGFAQQGHDSKDVAMQHLYTETDSVKPETVNNTETANAVTPKKSINIKLITIVVAVVVLIGVTGVGAWYWTEQTKNKVDDTGDIVMKENGEIEKTQEEIMESIAKKARSAKKQYDLQQIQMVLDENYQSYNQYPIALKDLDATPEIMQIIESGEILYAYSANKSNYHIGIEVESEVFTKDDFDFNSKLAEYTNGFNGADPIYDLVSDENIELGEISEPQMNIISGGDEMKDLSKARLLSTLNIAIEMYISDYVSCPGSLDEIVEYLVPDTVEIAKYNNFMYAVSDDGESFHLGVQLSSEFDELDYYTDNDSDFNSLEAGFENGFDGADPVYDMHGGGYN